jgi:hypothetical protein
MSGEGVKSTPIGTMGNSRPDPGDIRNNSQTYKAAIAARIKIRIEISCIRQMYRVCARMRDPWCNLRINPWENTRFRAHSHGAGWLRLFPLVDGKTGPPLPVEGTARLSSDEAGRVSASDGASAERRRCGIWNISGYWKHCPALFCMATRLLVSPFSDRYIVPADCVVEVCCGF